MKPLNDTRLRLLGPVCLFAFVAIFFRLNRYFFSWPWTTILLNDSVELAAGIFSWQVARWAVLRIQRYCPGLSNTRRRLLWLLTFMPLLVAVSWFVRHSVRYFIEGQFLYFTDTAEISRSIGIQFFHNFIYLIIYEGWYVLRKWHRETVETNTLEKVSLQSQLRSLQHQVNPHFLFNSLNSLSSLISECPNRADAFLDELTSVFRYLLQASERHLVPLAEEVEFIRSFGHLLQVRYPAGLVLDLSIDPAQESLLIPPLTLQMLVENAVRYNIILPEQPLHIRIYTTADRRLYVANTLQRKPLRVETTGAGLTNLTVRYGLLNEGELTIEEQPQWFVVSMPLVSTERIAELS
ncbi:sensor histidine kinase [Telluribacter sp.]|jgi:sensor histidine kinase YesM|uniref:sensor histidine kinase n=1 Tax=Telluribacter sp. TaxID=1978767 RepID=UPI002E0F7D82|nr:histidine kinase [Telluribacter sp.]